MGPPVKHFKTNYLANTERPSMAVLETTCYLLPPHFTPFLDRPVVSEPTPIQGWDPKPDPVHLLPGKDLRDHSLRLPLLRGSSG